MNPGSQTSGYNTYRDESNIYVFGYTVSDSGTISLPILGEIHVYGLTINEVADLLKFTPSSITAVMERSNTYYLSVATSVRLTGLWKDLAW